MARQQTIRCSHYRRKVRANPRISNQEYCVASVCQQARKNKWRRLSLIDDLPEEILEMVIAGKLSSWSASRVIAPMSRAMPSHCRKLCEHLKQEAFTTRQLSELWDHYLKSSRPQRERLIKEPALFLKTIAARRQEAEEKKALLGPVEKWYRDIEITTHMLARLSRHSGVVYEDQSVAWHIEKHCQTSSKGEPHSGGKESTSRSCLAGAALQGLQRQCGESSGAALQRS